MEIRQLVYFKRVAEMEHVTKAAESLYITQPTLSLAIRRLEDELGVPLFERKGRNVRLNEYGRIFYEEVSPAIDHLDNAIKKITECKEQNDNNVTIISPSLFIFPGMMDRVYELYPNIHVKRINSSSTHTPDYIGHMLVNHDIDLCITMSDISGNGIEKIPLRREPFALLVSENHHLAHRESISLDELVGEAFVLDMKGTAVRTNVDALCDQINFHPNVSYETHSEKDLCLSVATGRYIAIVPSIMDEGSEIKGVKSIPISNPVSKSVLSLYHLRDVKERRVVSEIVRIIREYFLSEYGPVEPVK